MTTKIPAELSSTPGIVDNSNATAITIDSSENVGIGGTTLTGWANKQVVLDGGSLTSVAYVMVNDTTGRSGTDGSVITLSGSDMYLIQRESANMIFRTANTERMRINSAGKVLLGTSTASSSTHARLVLGGGTENYIQFSSTNNVGGAIGVTSAGSIPFYTLTGAVGSESFSERMRIDSSGNVLIGTTSASNFPANERAITLLGSSMTISHNTSNGSGDSYVRFGRDTSVIGSITQSGNTAVAYNTTSDYRLKENVNYEFDALSRVKQLKPARFNFIADADTTVDGFIAHEVSDIVPEAITGEKDGEQMQGIDQSKLVPLLTKAIQEQQDIIDDLKSRIETLEG